MPPFSPHRNPEKRKPGFQMPPPPRVPGTMLGHFARLNSIYSREAFEVGVFTASEVGRVVVFKTMDLGGR